MADHDLQVQCDIFAIKAEGIVRELTKMARMLFRRGYGTTHLIFADWSIVTVADSGLRVVQLLRDGHRALGLIAPDRDRNRDPFIEPWELGDKAALAELRYLAHSIYWHLLPARNAQPHVAVRGNGGDHGK